MRNKASLTGVPVILLAIATAQPLVVSAGDHVYKSYANARFSYSISYPADLLIPQG